MYYIIFLFMREKLNHRAVKGQLNGGGGDGDW
jgi:hypothetical protein